MPNPLEKSINSGIKANAMIGDLFSEIGNKDNPRGYVHLAYTNARRSLASALKEQDRLRAATDVLVQLRETISRDTRTLFSKAQDQGAEESAKQLSYYQISSEDDPSNTSVQLSDENQSALAVVIYTVDMQTAAIRAMILTDATDEEIIGDDERVGVLRPGDVEGAAAFWATALLWNAFDWWTKKALENLKNNSRITLDPADFRKQAIAVIDKKTTDCCLKVHGQIQPLDQPFHLTGTPRFADYIDWPAFHRYCRTAGVLYHPYFDNGITDKMRASADLILKERAGDREKKK